MDIPDEVAEPVARADWERGPWPAVYDCGWDTWKQRNPQAFEFRMADIRTLLADAWPALQRLAVQEAIKDGRVAPVAEN